MSVYGSGNIGKLEIGDNAELTDIKMEDVSGANISLDDAKKEIGNLVLFSCNTCPFVLKWEGRYPELKEWVAKNEVGYGSVKFKPSKT